MSVVLERHLTHLLEFQIGYLRGDHVTVDPQRAGPLVSLLMTEEGWRADWPARVRRALQDAITAHSASIGKQGLAEHTTAALGMLWGVSEYPQERDAVARRIGKSAETVGRYERQARASTPIREELARLVDGLGEIPVVTSPRQPKVWEDFPEDWPDPGLRTELLERMSTHLKLTVRDPRDALHQLRAAVTDFLKTDYLSHDDHQKLYHQMAHVILVPWAEEDLLSFSALGRDPDQHHGTYTRALGAVAHLAFYEVTTDDTHMERFLKVIGGRAGAVKALALDAFTHEPGSVARLSPGQTDRMLQLLGENVVARTVSTPSVDPKDSDRHRPFDGAQAFREAKSMRDASGKEKELRARSYVQRRGDYVRLSDAPTKDPIAELARDSIRSDTVEADGALLALADQAVHLMLLNMRKWDLLDLLSKAIQKTGVGYSYKVLDWRNQGLRLSKLFDHRQGIALIVAAEDALKSALLEGSPHDTRAVMESLQQVALSAGGVCVRVLEEMLWIGEDEREHVGVVAYSRAALLWSWLALERLDAIAALPDGIARKRYDDFHIAWQGWYALARLQRVRAQIAARAAIMGEIVLESAFSGPEFACSVDDIEKGYRELITTPELSEENVDATIIHGLWLAMFRGGMVPVEANRAAALKEATLISISTDELEATDATEKKVKPDEIAMWMYRHKRFDPGVLGFLEMTGPVARGLNTTSNGLYAEWRSLLGARNSSDRPEGVTKY